MYRISLLITSAKSLFVKPLLFIVLSLRKERYLWQTSFFTGNLDVLNRSTGAPIIWSFKFSVDVFGRNFRSDWLGWSDVVLRDSDWLSLSTRLVVLMASSSASLHRFGRPRCLVCRLDTAEVTSCCWGSSLSACSLLLSSVSGGGRGSLRGRPLRPGFPGIFQPYQFLLFVPCIYMT